jgi:hypothetical protein
MPLLNIRTRPWRGRFAGLGVSNVTPTPAMQTLAQAIQTQEGYYPGTIAYTDNNPGNLRYAGQPGATSGPGGFAVFDSYADGQQALYNQLNLYATGTCGACGGQPLTIEQMTAIYAPAGDGSNNPTAYANNLANALGVTPDTQLSDVFGSTGVVGSSSTADASASSFDLTSMDPATLTMYAALSLGVLYVLSQI